VRRSGEGLHEVLERTLIQAAVYVGVPAANAAFRWVKEALGADLE
jgi:3-oxoadipate enol-lactonase / 4-carboxymuconolactone decarboxylase